MEIEPSQERSSVDGALAQWLATERPADRLNRVRDEMLADHRREAGGDTDGYPPMTMGDPHVIGFEKHVTDEQVSVFAHRAIDIRQPSRYVSTKSRYITPDVDNIGDPSRFYTGTSTHGTGKAMADHRNGKCSASTVASHLGDDGFGNIAAAGITFAANPTRPGTMFSVTPHVQWDGWGAVGVIPDEGIDGYVESILLLTFSQAGVDTGFADLWRLDGPTYKFLNFQGVSHTPMFRFPIPVGPLPADWTWYLQCAVRVGGSPAGNAYVSATTSCSVPYILIEEVPL